MNTHLKYFPDINVNYAERKKERKRLWCKDPGETNAATRQNRHDSADMKAWLNVLMKWQRD